MLRKSLSILKFSLGILLLPLVVGFSAGFYEELIVLDKTLTSYFYWGIASYLILHLFIYKPLIIYKKGQRILEVIFGFFSPLVKVANYLLPIYTIFLFFIYFIISVFTKEAPLTNYFLFLFSFSLSLHLILTTEVLRAKEDFLKANYIFGFSLIYILNLILLSFGLSLIFDKFSFVKFFNNSFSISQGIFSKIFTQLFL